MSSPDTTDRWNEEVRRGAHWDKGPSSRLNAFLPMLKAGARILDAGCGSGRDSLFLTRQGFSVTGVDIAPVAIEYARRAAEELSLSVTFELGDIQKLAHADESFDYVYCVYTLQHTDLALSVPELKRVLKDGGLGRLAILLQTRYDIPCGQDTYLDYDDVMRIISRSFQVLSSEIDKYSESDQHGRHSHVRLTMTVQRKTGR